MPLGKSTALAHGCLPAHRRNAQKFTLLFAPSARPNAVRPYSTKKEFFLGTFEAGMLLKTNEARNVRGLITQYVYENKALVNKCL